MKRSLFALILFLGIIFLTACSQVAIKNIQIDENTIPQNVIASELEINDIVLIINKTDGTTQRINLNESMISSTDLEKLTNAGSQTITIKYSDFETTFTINLVDNVLSTKLASIYQLGFNSSNITVTYEEWLESIKGPKGIDGREVTFQVVNNVIKWQYVGDSSWSDLLDLTSITQSNQTIEINVSGDNIMWKYSDEMEWKVLFSLDSVKGSDGINGENGKNGEN